MVSCSFDKSIIFYNKENNEYKKEYSIKTNGPNGPIIQTKDNEICYHELDSTISHICFYDLKENKIIERISKISIPTYFSDCCLMISKDLLLITGINKISIINVNLYNLIRIVDASGSSCIYTACLLNKNILLTVGQKKGIIQWKIEDDNIKKISKKENAHEDKIYTLLKLESGLILSGSRDKLVKIW